MIPGYGLRYWAKLRADPLPGESQGPMGVVSFYKKGYGGNPDELYEQEDEYIGSIQPVEIEMLGRDNSELVRARKAVIRLMANATLALADLFADTDRDFLVTIDEGADEQNLYNLFTGWVNPFDAREEDSKPPYPIELVASCGLGGLADIPFLRNPEKTGLTIMESLHDLLYTCLSWVGYELPLWVCIRTVEQSMLLDGVTRPPMPYNPLWFTKVIGSRFQDAGKPMNCQQVLDAICQAFNARLVQNRGRWELLRIDELPDPMNPRLWAVYTNRADATPSLGQEYPIKYLGHGYDLEPLSGGMVAIEAAKRRHELKFEYGERVNQVKNPTFSRVGLGNLPDSWTKYGAFTLSMVGDGTSETPFAVRLLGHSSDSQSDQDGAFIEQVIQRPARTGNLQMPSLGTVLRYGSQDAMTLTVDFLNVDTRAAKINVFAVFPNEPGSFNPVRVLQQDGSWEDGNTTKNHYIFLDNQYQDGELQIIGPKKPKFTPNMKAKPTTGERRTIECQPAPGQGAYEIHIRLCRGVAQSIPTPSSARIDYREVVVNFSDTSRLEFPKEVITMEAEGADRKKTEQHTLLIGDTPLSQVPTPRLGTLYRMDGQTPTAKWHHLSGRQDKLQSLAAWGNLRLTGRQGRVFDGKVLPTSICDPNTVIVGLELGEIKLFPVSHRWYWRERTVQVTATEILSVTAGTTKKEEAETADGGRQPLGGGTSLNPLKDAAKNVGKNIAGAFSSTGPVRGGITGEVIVGSSIKIIASSLAKRLRESGFFG